MNIPPAPPEGWTPSYLRQLRAIAEGIEPSPTAEERRWITEVWRTLTEAQLDEFFDATSESFDEFERVEQIMLDDHKEPVGSPEKRVAYLVADHRHRSFGVAALVRQLFERTPGVQTPDNKGEVIV